MARYRVTEDMPAGVVRAGVGHFKPGAEFTLPDAATPRDKAGNFIKEAPSKNLEPLDAEADAALVEAHPKLAAAGKLRRFVSDAVKAEEPTKPAKGASTK